MNVISVKTANGIFLINKSFDFGECEVVNFIWEPELKRRLKGQKRGGGGGLTAAKNGFTAPQKCPARPVRLFLECAFFVKMTVAGIISSSNKLAKPGYCKSAAFLSGKKPHVSRLN
jgi:hypothetical protein